MSVEVPARPAELYALSLALSHPTCLNPDPLIAAGLQAIREAGSVSLGLDETVYLADAAATFLHAADEHYPGILGKAGDLFDEMREDILTGATMPVPGSPAQPS